MCSPVDYFSFSNPVDFHSIGTPNQQSKHWLEKDYDLLVGGGGLLYQGFRDTLKLMLSGANRSIFWGGDPIHMAEMISRMIVSCSVKLIW